MTSADYNGIAVILTAAGTIGIQAFNAWQVGRARDEGKARDKKLTEVHDLVNGMSAAKTVSDKRAAFSEGKAEGIETERANPMTPAGQP